MDKITKKRFKSVFSKVNATLKYYEADWISAQRSPELDRTRVSSFEEFVEIRLNYEAYKLPELKQAVIATSGYLFKCDRLDDVNDLRHKFKKAWITLYTPDIFEEEHQGEIKKEIDAVREWLGGSKLSFNSVVERVKIVIEKD